MPNTLTFYKYHGPKRRLPSTSLQFHIVFSTYGTVAADFNRGGGVLNYFHWYRVILDEGGIHSYPIGHILTLTLHSSHCPELVYKTV